MFVYVYVYIYMYVGIIYSAAQLRWTVETLIYSRQLILLMWDEKKMQQSN